MIKEQVGVWFDHGGLLPTNWLCILGIKPGTFWTGVKTPYLARAGARTVVAILKG